MASDAGYLASPLRPYQVRAVEATLAEWDRGVRSTMIVSATGCHRAGTLLLMHDGSVRAVEDVRVGDRLMGPDSTPRTVLDLARGEQEMVEIRPVKGEPWVVNMDHVLSLQPTRRRSGQDRGPIVDVTCREWIGWSKARQGLYKLFRVGVDFPQRPEPTVDPYVLGLLLGDGGLSGNGGLTLCKPDEEIWPDVHREAARWGVSLVDRTSSGRAFEMAFSSGRTGGRPNPLMNAMRSLGLYPIASENRFIPDDYRLGSRDTRLAVLAGLLDTDGHLTNGGYDFISKSRRLSDELAFVARSLGLAAYVKPSEKWCQTGAGGTYYRVSVSGDCSILPLRIARKRAAPRRQKRSVLRTGFDVVPTGTVEPYYGFALDGDRRYLLADFTVTHNTGKTRLASEIVARRAPHGPVLWLAHRLELLDQAADAIRRNTGLRVGLEQAEKRAKVRGLFGASDDVVVASIQTMNGARLQKFFRPDDFATIVIDECHRSPAKSFRKLLDYFGPAQVVGITATPDRADKVGLHNVFETSPFQYGISDAISDGFLCDIRSAEIVIPGLDIGAVRTTCGELNAGDLADLIDRDAHLHSIAHPLVRESGSRPTVVFMPSVDSSRRLAEIMRSHTDAGVRWISGETAREERARILAEYQSGAAQYLINCALLTEGWDAPHTACVGIVRPTKSRALYEQMIGRGTRLSPGKTDLLVLDFVPQQAGRHRLVCPADVLAGKDVDDEILSIARTIRAARPAMPEREVLEAAERERADRQRRAAEAEDRRRAKAAAAVQYRTRAWDPFGIVSDADLAGSPMTAATQRQLDQYGLRYDDSTTEEAARRLLNNRIYRIKAGLCSQKQAMVLAARGLRTDVTFAQAKTIIDAIMANGPRGWRNPTPDRIKTQYRRA